MGCQNIKSTEMKEESLEHEIEMEQCRIGEERSEKLKKKLAKHKPNIL